jgi:hypothetical protein
MKNNIGRKRQQARFNTPKMIPICDNVLLSSSFIPLFPKYIAGIPSRPQQANPINPNIKDAIPFELSVLG